MHCIHCGESVETVEVHFDANAYQRVVYSSQKYLHIEDEGLELHLASYDAIHDYVDLDELDWEMDHHASVVDAEVESGSFFECEHCSASAQYLNQLYAEGDPPEDDEQEEVEQEAVQVTSALDEDPLAAFIRERGLG